MITTTQFVRRLGWTKLIAAATVLLLSISLLLVGASSDKDAATNNAVAVGMRTARTGACAANLKDGSVFITGGRGTNGVTAGSEVFHAK